MRIGSQCYGRCLNNTMDELTYRREVLAYQVFVNDNWWGDYATEYEACNAMHRLVLELEAGGTIRNMEIRRLVQEYWNPKN